MSFQLNTNSLRSVRSYEEAARYFASTKPIRGFDKDYNGVPLNTARKSSQPYWLVRRGDAYAARLYNTDVVTFKPDGGIVLDSTYNSNTTRAFADFFTPCSISVHSFGGNCVVRDAEGVFYAPIAAPVRFSPNHLADRSALPQMGVPYTDRKLATAARKECAPLMDYLRTMRALGPISCEAVREMKGAHTGVYELTARNAHWLTNHAMFPVVVATLYRSRYDGQTTNIIADAKVKQLNALILRAGGAIKTRPLPAGVLHRNAVFL